MGVTLDSRTDPTTPVDVTPSGPAAAATPTVTPTVPANVREMALQQAGAPAPAGSSPSAPQGTVTEVPIAPTHKSNTVVDPVTERLTRSADDLYRAFNGHLGRNNENKVFEILSKISPEEMPAFKEIYARKLQSEHEKHATLDTYGAAQLGLRDNDKFQRMIGFNADIVAKDLRTAFNNGQSEMILVLLRGRTPEEIQAISGAFKALDKKHDLVEAATRYYKEMHNSGTDSPHEHDLDTVLALVAKPNPARVAGNLIEAAHDKDINRFTQNLTDGNHNPLSRDQFSAVDAQVRARTEHGQGIADLANDRFRGENLERANNAISACQANPGAVAAPAAVAEAKPATDPAASPEKKKISSYTVSEEDRQPGLWGVSKKILIESGVEHPTVRQIMNFDRAIMAANNLDEQGAKRLRQGRTLNIPDIDPQLIANK